jgi:biopolymer transport protein TolQ
MGNFFWRTALEFGNPAAQQGNVGELVLHTGPAVQMVLYLLVAASVISWAIIFSKFYQIYVARRGSRRFARVFWDTANLPSIYAASIEMSTSPMAQVFRAGYQELTRLTGNSVPSNPTNRIAANGTGEIESVGLAMQRVIREHVRWLERSLSFLATTGSTAPFIGLFGTVWGIMNAFQGLSSVQSSSLQAVAPGIAEALVATAVGLGAAIPAVMAYNYFRRQVRLLASDLEHFSVEFLNIARRYFL